MASTTNYNWTTPDDTSLVKDGAAAIRTLGSSIDTTTKNLNPQTTTGALAYRSATSNVNTALPIGTAGQILAVNSGATAPEWIAAPSSGGMTSIASGSLPTGTTILTISSIPTTYNQLLLQIYNVSGVSASNILRVRINNISTASSYGAENDGYISLPNLTAIQLNGTNNTFDAAASQIFAEISFTNYAATNAVKMGRYQYGNTADDIYIDGFWLQKTQNTTAITRIDVISSNANFQTGGTYTLWGIK